MNQNRRRKKRPSYGVRTIEIARGRNGFGFTISGQAPCILSCIVNTSPAERAGLRPGDYLIAVNGQNVSKALHDDVVRMIGSCQGLLKLQIAENYYSNSSDDEITPTTRPRPKYPHRFRQRQQQNHGQTQQLTAFHDVPVAQQKVDNHDYKNIVDMHLQAFKNRIGTAEALPKTWNNTAQAATRKYSEFAGTYCSTSSSGHRSEKKPQQLPRAAPTESAEKENRPLFSEHEINSIVYPSLQQLQCNSERPVEEPIYKAVVGYLGTIEMPKEPQLAGHRLSAIRNCIRRLRVEKKVHTLVLMKVFTDKVTLTNSHGATMAEYPTERITFCGAYADDKKFFGLVTTRAEAAEEDTTVSSSSCHVFMVDTKLLQHEEHLKRAKSFRIDCVPDMGSGRGECCEFPESIDPILVAIVGLYRNRMDFEANVSPQPSNTSSNSDSGIGFRDEGQHSDRVSIVDMDNEYGYLFPLPQPPLWKMAALPQCVPVGTVLRNTCKMDSLPQNPEYAQSTQNVRNPEALPNSRNLSQPSATSRGSSVLGNRLAVRAMPDATAMEQSKAESTSVSEKHSSQLVEPPPNIRKGLHKYLQAKFEPCHLPPAEPPCGKLVAVIEPPASKSTAPDSSTDLMHKLSPKVYDCVSWTNAGDSETLSTEQPDYDVDSDEAPTLPDDVTENACEQEGSQDVHPPTQEEDSDVSAPDNDVYTQDGGRRWSRSNSFRKQLKFRFGQSKSQEGTTTLSDGELINGKESNSGSMVGLYEAANDCNGGTLQVGRVGSWAVTFENLLKDSAGLHTFAEFLKKEFSYENIVFWVACERFRRLTDENHLKISAKEIFQKHLALGSVEPVNVDSHARQLVEEKMESPSADLFWFPQKQIYDLMKFDCYTRFLKSRLYQECMVKEVSGKPLPFLGDANLDPEVPDPLKNDKRTATKNEGEDRRRKSLLPWNRTKSGKNKKEKSSGKKGEKKDEACSSSLSDLTGSRSSLASADIPLMQRQLSSMDGFHNGDSQDIARLCRVLLPDKSTTMMFVRSGESVAVSLGRILQRRGLSYGAFDAYMSPSNKVVDQERDCAMLGGQEVCIEERLPLKIELLTKKVVAVKAKPTLPLVDVLRPILLKHDCQVEQISVKSDLDGNIDMSRLASSFKPNQTFTVVKNNFLGGQPVGKQAALSELTSKVLGDLLNQAGTLDSKEGPNQSVHDARGYHMLNNCPAKPPVASRPKKQSEDMFDLWKRAQRSRLDDQRGTEINTELPEFLRDEANHYAPGRHYPDGRASEPNPITRPKIRYTSKFSRLNSEVISGRSRLNVCDDSLLKDGILPTPQQAEEYFSSCHLGELRSNEQRSLQDLGGLFGMQKNSRGCNPLLLRPCSHPPPSSSMAWLASPFQGSPMRRSEGAAAYLDKSMSPSSVPPAEGTQDTSIHGDLADYLPPSPLCTAIEQCPPPQIPLRLPTEPPPLPPKPRPNRRPVPPAPSICFGAGVFLNGSDEDKCAINKRRLSGSGSEQLCVDKFSVSFV